MLKQYLRRLDCLSEPQILRISWLTLEIFDIIEVGIIGLLRIFARLRRILVRYEKSWCLTLYCYFIQKVNDFANNLFDDFCWYLHDILPFLSDFWHLTKLDVYQTVDQSLKNLNLGHIWLPVKDASLNSHNSAAKYCLRCWGNTDSSGHY